MKTIAYDLSTKFPFDLDAQIREASRKGYQIQSRTDTTAIMVKPKKFSFIFAVLWFLMLGLGLIVYLLWYWSKRDEVIYLSARARVATKSMEQLEMEKVHIGAEAATS